jgi:hypothetical protein
LHVFVEVFVECLLSFDSSLGFEEVEVVLLHLMECCVHSVSQVIHVLFVLTFVESELFEFSLQGEVVVFVEALVVSVHLEIHVELIVLGCQSIINCFLKSFNLFKCFLEFSNMGFLVEESEFDLFESFWRVIGW